jgi:hypothetical protein
LIVSHYILGHPDDVLQLQSAYGSSCGEKTPEGITRPASQSGGRATNSLSTVSDSNVFAIVLVNKIENLKRDSTDFENILNSQQNTP